MHRLAGERDMSNDTYNNLTTIIKVCSGYRDDQRKKVTVSVSNKKDINQSLGHHKICPQ